MQDKQGHCFYFDDSALDKSSFIGCKREKKEQ